MTGGRSGISSWSTAGAAGRGWRYERVASRSGTALDRAGGAAHPSRSHGPYAARRTTRSERLVTGILSVISAFLVVQGAEVTASVDHTRVRVGDELMLTIRAHTRAADPVEIMLPSLNGFAIVGSRDMTEVAINRASGSTRTTVRELQLRAQQAGALLIGPVRARQGVSVVATDPILVTVDSAADRPVLTLVTPEGVWAYPPATSSGVALSRQVGGRWIDLFIAHEVVFPLVAGRL